jgi:hypothetical protein
MVTDLVDNEFLCAGDFHGKEHQTLIVSSSPEVDDLQKFDFGGPPPSALNSDPP